MRRRFEVQNATRYRTADIRKLLREAAARVFDPGQKPIIRCTVAYARHGVSGCAFVGGTRMTIRIAKGGVDVREVAATMVHELGHLRGLRHPEMRGAARWTWKGVQSTVDAQTGEEVGRYERHLRAHSWAMGFALHEDDPAHKPRLSGAALIEARRERTVLAMERWTKKKRRADTALKKLRARLKYYDRRRAAAPEA